VQRTEERTSQIDLDLPGSQMWQKILNTFSYFFICLVFTTRRQQLRIISQTICADNACTYLKLPPVAHNNNNKNNNAGVTAGFTD
jgi:hypothetical protein